MQFDWTTFALEGLNFLVLMWILTRFLYRPVLNVLDARQKAVADQVSAAQHTHAEAEAIKARYEARLSEWQHEREQARQALERELSGERTARLRKITEELSAEREKAQQRDAAAATLREQALAHQAAEKAYRHVSMMLQRLASGELTARIVVLFEEDLASWKEDRRETLRHGAAAMQALDIALVSSAQPLDDASRQRIAKALQAVLARPLNLDFKVQPDLIAGLRVAVGPCLLQASLADELGFFMEQDLHA